MDGISSAASGMSASQVQGQVNTALLKKTQDLAKQNVAQLLSSIPQAPSMGGVGGNIDITG